MVARASPAALEDLRSEIAETAWYSLFYPNIYDDCNLVAFYIYIWPVWNFSWEAGAQ